TPSRSAISCAMSGATPTGSPVPLCPVTSRKLARLMPARSTPFGARSERASCDIEEPGEVGGRLRSRLGGNRGQAEPEHDPEKWEPVFAKDHAPVRRWSGMPLRSHRIPLRASDSCPMIVGAPKIPAAETRPLDRHGRGGMIAEPGGG